MEGMGRPVGAVLASASGARDDLGVGFAGLRYISLRRKAVIRDDDLGTRAAEAFAKGGWQKVKRLYAIRKYRGKSLMGIEESGLLPRIQTIREEGHASGK